VIRMWLRGYVNIPNNVLERVAYQRA